MKHCTKCNQEKSIDLFGKDKRHADQHKSVCKPCVASAAKIKRWGNIDICRARERRYGQQHKDLRRDYDLRRRTGASLEHYQTLFTAQSGGCGACGKISNGSLCMDHNHVTGELRNLLCSRCNLIVGWIEKDTTYLYSLASPYITAYAQRWGIV